MSPYRIPVYRVRLVRHARHSVAQREVREPRSAVEVVRSYLNGADREHLVAILLDARDSIIGINTVSVGTLTASLVHCREVFKPAILANAAAIILAHNHISGDPMPSPEDRETSKRIIAAGKLIGIEVVDFLILGHGGRYYSALERCELS